MIREARPLAQITAEVIRILYREIGIVDTRGFVNQYTAGYGDYSAQREELFAGMTLDSILSEIKESRKRYHPGHRKEAQRKKTATDNRIRRTQTGRQKST